MSESTASVSGREMRRHRRYRLPSRGHLAVAIAIVETIFAAVLVAVLLPMLTGAGFSLVAFAVALLSGLIFGALSAKTALRYLARLDPRQPVILEACFGWVAAYGCGLAVVVFAGDTALISRGALALLFVIGGIGVVGLRALVYIRLTEMMTMGRLQLEHVGVTGAPADLASYLTNGQIWRQGAQVVETLGLEPGTVDRDARLEAFVARCAQSGCTQVIFVSDLSDLHGMERAAHLCKRYALDVAFAPTPLNSHTRLLDISPLGPNNAVQVVKRPMGLRAVLTKRIFDIAAASAGLVLLSPLFLVIGILIKLDSPGPVFYRQARRGFNGEEFPILKFRSMRVMEDGRAMVQAQVNDPRITRIGAFIRRTSIDELPQLFNVLEGRMSLVGPRPHAISHDAQLSETLAQYAHRQRVKPGITGWAQVNGFRGDTSSLEKIEGRTLHDLYYIENWSVLFDIWIVLLTVFSRKTRANAH